MNFIKKSLASKIFLQVIIPVLLVFVIAGGLVLQTASRVTTQSAQETLALSAQATSASVSGFFGENIQIARQMAANQAIAALFSDLKPGSILLSAPGIEQVRTSMSNIQATNKDGILSSWIADMDSNQLVDSSGNTPPPGWKITDSQWYQDVTKANGSVLTAPYVDTATKKIVASAVAPVYLTQGSPLVGVVGIDISLDKLKVMLEDRGIDKNAVLVAGNGLVTYHADSDKIGKQITEVPALSGAAGVIAAGTTGAVRYTQDKQDFYGYIEAVPGSDWHFLTAMTDTQYFAAINAVVVMLIAIFAAGIVLLMLVIVGISRGITRPIKRLAAEAKQIADGKLDVAVNIRSRDEIGLVSIAIRDTVTRLQSYIRYIEEITGSLDAMASGKLQLSLTCDYAGEFSLIKRSLINISETLGQTLGQIDTTAVQIAVNAERVASGSQELNEGAAQQLTSIQELSGSAGETSVHVREMADYAFNAKELGQQARENLNACSGQVQQLNDAIGQISGTSGQIGKIIKVIEDIAFQTNILALNASVEAARAGAAGKGFSVVADEVRNLASKSSAAAKDISSLIGESIQSIQSGSTLANQTAQAMLEAVENANQVIHMVDKIAHSTAAQSQSLDQITTGISQIAAVTRISSNTAEQSAAASAELDEQARTLKRLVALFETGKSHDEMNYLHS